MSACRCGWPLPKLRVSLEATIGSLEPLGVLVTLVCPSCGATFFETLRHVDKHGGFVAAPVEASCDVVTGGTRCLFVRGHRGPHMYQPKTGGKAGEKER